jgi:hypothetical protein
MALISTIGKVFAAGPVFGTGRLYEKSVAAGGNFSTPR